MAIRKKMRLRAHRRQREWQAGPVQAQKAHVPATKDPVASQVASLPPVGTPERQRAILAMQRHYGNRYVQQVLNSQKQQSRAAGKRKMVRRKAHATTADPAAPEQTTVNLTGSYEALEPGGNNRITIQINQAGHHFEGWYQRREYSSAFDHAKMIQHRLAGDFISQTEDNATFTYARRSESGAEQATGRLVLHKPGSPGATPRMVMYGDTGWSHTFEKVGSSARASTEALAHVPENLRQEMVASIAAPLDREEETRLVGYCEQIRGQVREYLSESGIMRAAIASKINKFIREMMSTYAAQQRPLVLRRMREELIGAMYTSGKITRPYWDWLQIIVIEQPGFTEAMQNRLGLRPDGADGQQHKYRFMISTVGASGDIGIGAQAMVGTIIIEKLEPDQWRQAYFIGFAGVSAGPSAGVSVGQTTNWSEFQTPFPWQPGNFSGFFSLGGATLSGSFVAGGGNAPAAVLVFDGDGSFAPLAVDASGWFLEYGAHIGAEVGATWGYIGGGRKEVVARVRPPESVSQEVNYQAGVDVHFEVDDPSLSDEGRAAIRQTCATHLKALENPASTLQIDGFTSTTGTEKRNQTLSELRAQNTLQAIKDVTGDRLHIPPGQMEATGHGEKPARDAGVPDNTEDPAWRKVEVRLNGTVVLVLH